MAFAFTAAAGTESRIGVATTKYGIGTTATDGATDSYDEIRGVISFPDFGSGTADEVSQPEISSAGNKKAKGLIQYGGGDMEFTYYEGDAGQDAIKAAAADFAGVDYNILVELPDIATPITGHGTRYFLKAVVRGFQLVAVNGPNNIYKVKVSLSFNDVAEKVAAT
jgi:hypothetical protein